LRNSFLLFLDVEINSFVRNPVTYFPNTHFSAPCLIQQVYFLTYLPRFVCRGKRKRRLEQFAKAINYYRRNLRLSLAMVRGWIVVVVNQCASMQLLWLDFRCSFHPRVMRTVYYSNVPTSAMIVPMNTFAELRRNRNHLISLLSPL
jgi:hypothetical protein